MQRDFQVRFHVLGSHCSLHRQLIQGLEADLDKHGEQSKIPKYDARAYAALANHSEDDLSEFLFQNSDFTNIQKNKVSIIEIR